MGILPSFEQLSLKEKIQELTEQVTVECKSALTKEDVKRIFDIKADSFLTGSEVTDGLLKFTGRVIFCVVYENAEGLICKAEAGAEFSGKIENAEILAGKKALVVLSVEKVDILSADDGYVYKAVVKAVAEVSGITKVQSLTGGDELIIRKEERPFVKSYGLKKGGYPVEEEFEFGFPVAEVLSHDTKVLTTSCQCGIGCIIVDGEIVLSLAVLQKMQNSDILKISKTFPFRLEIECEEAMPVMRAFARAFPRSTKLDIVVDEDSGKSVATATINLDLYGEAFEEFSVEVVEDAYSSAREVELCKNCFGYEKPLGIKTFTKQVNCRGALKESLTSGLRIMSVALETVNILTQNKEEDNALIEGVISAVGYAKDIDGIISSVKFDAPFSITLENCLDGADDFLLDGAVTDLNAKFVSLEEVDVTATIRFTVSTKKSGKIEIITDLKEGEEKKENHSAISVYIPRKGEDLWTVSKRLNACPEEIMALNSDLQFPLTGEERILIYRQDKKNY